MYRSFHVQFRGDTTLVRESNEVVTKIPAYFHSESYVITKAQPLNIQQVLGPDF